MEMRLHANTSSDWSRASSVECIREGNRCFGLLVQSGADSVMEQPLGIRTHVHSAKPLQRRQWPLPPAVLGTRQVNGLESSLVQILGHLGLPRLPPTESRYSLGRASKIDPRASRSPTPSRWRIGLVCSLRWVLNRFVDQMRRLVALADTFFVRTASGSPPSCISTRMNPPQVKAFIENAPDLGCGSSLRDGRDS